MGRKGAGGGHQVAQLAAGMGGGAERSAAGLRLEPPEAVAVKVSEVGGVAIECGSGPVEAFAGEHVGEAVPEQAAT